ncbi:MAG TPA: hypothetical protein VGK84_01630 [Candidatus Tumulicola sp.]
MNSRALPPAAIAVLVVCSAAVWQPTVQPRAVGSIATAQWPYLPGSRIAIQVDGFAGPYLLRVLGPGRLNDRGTYEVPDAANGAAATLVAGNAAGIASANVKVVPPPPPARDELAVASYDDGVVLHRARGFAVDGVLGIGGAPGDVAASGNRLIAIDTQGDRATTVSRGPWNVSGVGGVPLGDQVALDATGNAYVTNRELSGRGGLTRISRDGSLASVVTGATAEGIAIDSKRGLVYVANANDGTVAVVDLRSMRVLRRFHAVDRVFSLALDARGARLFAVSNQSTDPPFSAAGSVVAFDVRSQPHRIARSANLTFPLGIAYDATRDRVFVTDESADMVYVLNAVTLRSQRAPLSTCETPWKPYLDALARRLYIPCARSSQVDVFDEVTLHRIAGAPFATGGYPLSVAAWHGSQRRRT